MIELAFFAMFAAALIGSLIAGLWDLKTTEIPDEIPTLMAALGIFTWFVVALTYGLFFYLEMSLVIGTIFLAFGWVLYKAGQWGGGDAKLLAAIGYMIPLMPGTYMFSFMFFMNVFLVGAAYVIIYSIILGLLNPKTLSFFHADLKKTWKTVFIIPMVAAASFIALMLYVNVVDFVLLSGIFFSILFLMLFWRYARVIEKHVFMKEIPASSLRVGDVLTETKTWDGLTQEEVNNLRKSRKKFIVKEGVRFGPVFFLALIVTLVIGNTLIFFI